MAVLWRFWYGSINDPNQRVALSGFLASTPLVSESGVMEASGTTTPTGGEPLEPPPGEMAEGQHWLGMMWLLLAC